MRKNIILDWKNSLPKNICPDFKASLMPLLDCLAFNDSNSFDVGSQLSATTVSLSWHLTEPGILR